VSDIIKPGEDLLFMKVGTHANESLDEIIERKQAEIDAAGFALWGYGGNTCHPLTMVQPFARAAVDRGNQIHLCMEPMDSNHFAVTERATEFSVDGINWERIDPAINVIGSRYALAIKDLKQEEFELPLAQTEVAVGNNKGRRGDRYIRGRVDKACLEVVGPPIGPEEPEGKIVPIGLVAEVVEPYAVIVRD
jgi:hypothetical protein